jgi:hypothetical protein
MVRKTEGILTPEQQRALGHIMERYLGRQPSYSYLRHGQWRFCWSTEVMGDGKYAAFIYRPIGPGSRSGKAKHWKLVKEVRFSQRKMARTRAGLWCTRSHMEHPQRDPEYAVLSKRFGVEPRV